MPAVEIDERPKRLTGFWNSTSAFFKWVTAMSGAALGVVALLAALGVLSPNDKVKSTASQHSIVISDVRQLSTQLLCRDLKKQGVSYSAAMDYWRINGKPDRMDADHNGIPCETVYPAEDVTSYWNMIQSQPTPRATVYDLPPGLMCHDLQARGFRTFEALEYYVFTGRPAIMDADKNGIPCETVYPDAAAVWKATQR